jgi:hypothetical protein
MAGKGGLAKEVRAGLELTKEDQVKNDSVVASGPHETSRLDDMWMRKTIRRHLIEFAEVFALVFLLCAIMTTYKHGPSVVTGYWCGAAAVILAIGFVKPIVLHPLWKGWMALGHYLGAVMSVVILSAAWTIMVVPIALLLRLLRIRVMDTRYGAAVDSYWEKRDPKHDDFSLMLKRQF